jgi:hypothetical protein
MTWAAIVLFAALGLSAAAAPLTLPIEPAERMRGICLEGPPRRPDADPMPEMASLGVNWVSLTPFAHMSSDSSPDLRTSFNAGWWGESDEGLIECARWANAAGMRVMLKPHIWIRSRGSDAWRGTISMASEEAWGSWFDRYEEWMNHYAELAEREQIEALVVGTELIRASLDPRCEPHWRRVIASVRERYSGLVLWSAHWEREFEDLPFWDALDAMGVGVYFPLSQSDVPTDEELRASWRRAVRRIAEVSEEHQLPVIFTEIGYRSVSDAAKAPWLWQSEAPVDNELQRRLYEVMFEECWDQPWFGGLFVWKWYARTDRRGRHETDFTPQGKPALEVIRRWFQREP